jgi:tetrahydromethanopterin S-methyltransferase subunit B
VDLSTVARACLRRFYVVFLIVGLAGYYAVQLYEEAQPQYSVTASVVVVQSPSLTLIRAGGPSANPYGAGNGAFTLATVLSDSLNTRTIQGSLVPAGSGLIAAWDSETAQLVTLTTTSATAEGSQSSMAVVLASVDPVLRDIQVRAGAPVDQLYVASLGSPADVPLETFPDRLRTVVAVVLAGLLVAVVLAVVLDSLLLRRRANRHAAPGRSRGDDSGPGFGRHAPAEDHLAGEDGRSSAGSHAVSNLPPEDDSVLVSAQPFAHSETDTRLERPQDGGQ